MGSGSHSPEWRSVDDVARTYDYMHLIMCARAAECTATERRCIGCAKLRTDRNRDPLCFGNVRMSSPLALVPDSCGIVPVAKIHLFTYSAYTYIRPDISMCTWPQKAPDTTCQSWGCGSCWRSSALLG